MLSCDPCLESSVKDCGVHGVIATVSQATETASDERSGSDSGAGECVRDERVRARTLKLETCLIVGTPCWLEPGDASPSCKPGAVVSGGGGNNDSLPESSTLRVASMLSMMFKIWALSSKFGAFPFIWGLSRDACRTLC